MTRQHLAARHIVRTALQSTILFALVLAFSAAPLQMQAQAQTEAQASSKTPPLNGVAHIAIRVHKFDTSRDFYKRLGFDEAFALSRNGAVYQSFIKLNDRQFIELYPVTPKNPGTGFLHLCFESDDLNAVYQNYLSRGLTPTRLRKAGAGNLLFTLKGPMQADQPQNIEYTQYMPGSRHYTDRGQHLGADRVGTKLISVTLAMQDPSAARDFYAKQLQFTPDAPNSMIFDLPGTSGEQVEIVPAASLGSKARITLATSSLANSAKLLKQAHLSFKRSKKSLIVTDPDGNLIVIEAR